MRTLPLFLLLALGAPVRAANNLISVATELDGEVVADVLHSEGPFVLSREWATRDGLEAHLELKGRLSADGTLEYDLRFVHRGGGQAGETIERKGTARLQPGRAVVLNPDGGTRVRLALRPAPAELGVPAKGLAAAAWWVAGEKHAAAEPLRNDEFNLVRSVETDKAQAVIELSGRIEGTAHRHASYQLVLKDLIFSDRRTASLSAKGIVDLSQGGTLTLAVAPDRRASVRID